MTWVVFGLGLVAVPANWFFIQFWRWASSHHATETNGQAAVALTAIGVVLAIAGGAILAMVKRWRRTAIGLSLLQLTPPVFVASVFAVGAL